jgi:hypothetical protein
MTKDDYRRYLQSPHWLEFSARIKGERRDRCENCQVSNAVARLLWGQGLNVHHLSYDNLGDEQNSDVVVLCYGCHMQQHGVQVGGPERDFFGYEKRSLFPFPDQRTCRGCGVLSASSGFQNTDAIDESLCSNCSGGLCL